MSSPKPVVLCILDGWGLRDEEEANAPKLADTPTFDRIMATCPNATLVTHGRDVGLPAGQMGNSEVGHTNIGAGRVVAMDLGQIDLAIEDGSFFENAALLEFAETLRSTGGIAHVAGLASPGGVHSHQSHIVAAAKALTDCGLQVAIHVITDGRDVPPKSAASQVRALEGALPEGAQIVTVTGRFYAMDRDNRWERVQQAYNAMVSGVGEHQVGRDPVDIIEDYYATDITDEFLPATVIGDYQGMSDGDGLFFVNFRADRAREILAAIGDTAFEGFYRETPPKLAELL
ncbi:MAG: 2,3-bisphosphoglycerate-independent phosphoglycerate mutase, partial [Pseudomonadota bacterium]